MKNWLQALLLSLPLTGAAQPPGMSEEAMQQMLERAQKMQECMANIDEKALQDLEAKSRKFEQQIKALCRAGKRDEAQALAFKFGRQMADDETIKKMRQCSKIMHGMVPQLAIPSEQELKQRHICDNY